MTALIHLCRYETYLIPMRGGLELPKPPSSDPAFCICGIGPPQKWPQGLPSFQQQGGVLVLGLRICMGFHVGLGFRAYDLGRIMELKPKKPCSTSS